MEKKMEVLWDGCCHMVMIGYVDYRVVSEGNACHYEIRFYDSGVRPMDWKADKETFSLKAWKQWSEIHNNSLSRYNPLFAPLSKHDIEELTYLTEKLEKETA